MLFAAKLCCVHVKDMHVCFQNPQKRHQLEPKNLENLLWVCCLWTWLKDRLLLDMGPKVYETIDKMFWQGCYWHDECYITVSLSMCTCISV